MKLFLCSWYETQEIRNVQYHRQFYNRDKYRFCFLLLNNTSRTSKSLLRTRRVLTGTFVRYGASIFMILFLTLSPEYFKMIRPCFISRCHKCLQYSSTSFSKVLTEDCLAYCMCIALISSGSRFTIESLCTKNNLTILICWGWAEIGQRNGIHNQS